MSAVINATRHGETHRLADAIVERLPHPDVPEPLARLVRRRPARRAPAAIAEAAAVVARLSGRRRVGRSAASRVAAGVATVGARAVRSIRPMAAQLRRPAAAKPVTSALPWRVGRSRSAATPTKDKEDRGMLGFARRVVAVFFGGLAATAIISAVAALSIRGRLAPTATTDPAADEIVAVSIFGPLAFRSKARAFRGGTLDCWYGGGVLDLRDATVSPEGALLRVRAVFGGGQILVPETWRVHSTIRGVGGVNDGRPKAELTDAAPELTIEGFVVFGGFAVMSELPAEQEHWLETVEAAGA
jgi:hypothetical protein